MTTKPAKHQDIAGKAFGRLTAVERRGRNPRGYAIWLCRCECGVEKELPSQNLLQGRTLSCGCLRKDARAKRGAQEPAA